MTELNQQYQLNGSINNSQCEDVHKTFLQNLQLVSSDA